MRVEINTRDLYLMQEEIASKAIIEDQLRALSLVAGADQAFFREATNGNTEGREIMISAVVVLEYPSLKFLYHSSAMMPVDFPYIPGLLSFREAPAIIEAFHKLDKKPDLLLIDGCGINHPRFAGLATHVGVLLDIPTIGVAKNILCGSGTIPSKPGEANLIRYHGREVGYYLKSKKGCRPLVVAPGHKVSLDTSLTIVKSCIRKYKLPEPTRLAHLCVNKLKKDEIRRLTTTG
ncbi:MAG: deoxyribonuclease V [Methanophagales archaeon]|nr:deoxyribonuclease V [Methanophagales archaeon]MCW3140052.1 deoxyribonuclease V [Methanophagales archaeon]